MESGVSLVKNNITDGMDSPSFISYRGGPGSVLSIGNTNIRFSDQRTGESNPLSVDSPTQFYGTYKPNFEAGSIPKIICGSLRLIINPFLVYIAD
jgi:hypothetical protein